MTGPSLLRAAVDELYSSPMTEFTTLRKALATAARKAGDRDAAVEIAALRKPTLSADTLNRLVRTAPDEVDELLELGTDLRAAEKALDAATLRDLTTKRRHLVNDLARLAFDITEQPNPSASVRDEVTSTLNAALADERIAEMLLSGALVTQARWDGFGSTSLPELAAVLPLDPNRRRTGTSPSRPSVPDRAADLAQKAAAEKDATAKDATAKAAAEKKATAKDATAKDAAAKDAAAKAHRDREDAERQAQRAEAERAHEQRLAVAAAAAQEAQEAAAAARQAVADIDRRISELSLQLAHARELAVKAQKDLREAETLRRNTQLALTRAGGAVDLRDLARDAPGRAK